MFLTIESASGGGKKIRSANIWTSVEELFKFFMRKFNDRSESRHKIDFKYFLTSSYLRPAVYYVSTNDETKGPKKLSNKELLELAVELGFLQKEELDNEIKDDADDEDIL